MQNRSDHDRQRRLADSRERQIVDLESRGYPARNKTDAEIVEMMRLPPSFAR